MLDILLLIIGRPPRPTRTDTLVPYTPLFRSCLHLGDAADGAQGRDELTVARPAMAAQVQDAQTGVARRHVGLLAQPLSREAGREVVQRCIETYCSPASGAVGRPLPRMWIQGTTRNQGNSEQLLKPEHKMKALGRASRGARENKYVEY